MRLYFDVTVNGTTFLVEYIHDVLHRHKGCSKDDFKEIIGEEWTKGNGDPLDHDTINKLANIVFFESEEEKKKSWISKFFKT